jgi:hypothetical protein
LLRLGEEVTVAVGHETDRLTGLGGDLLGKQHRDPREVTAADKALTRWPGLCDGQAYAMAQPFPS